MEINNKVWDILSQDEKTSITLSLGFEKSSWEGGEIMKKAHFKYLEIQNRAQYFLQLFHNYFSKYPDGLFIEDHSVSSSFKEYLCNTILYRKSVSNTIRLMEDQRYMISSIKEKLIIAELNTLLNSEKECDKDLYNLIMEFDRWNNFRILPYSVQEPSAFKRRNKKRDLSYLKMIISLDANLVESINQRFTTKSKNCYYLPIVSLDKLENYQILRVKNTTQTIEELTSLGLLVFKNYTEVYTFYDLVYNYFKLKNRSCKIGLDFWPKYRETVNKAINYDNIERISKLRTFIKGVKVINV